MNVVTAIDVAAKLCIQHGRRDVANALYRAQEWRSAVYATEMRAYLRTYNIDFDAFLEEMKASNGSNDLVWRKRISAKMALITDLLAEYNKPVASSKATG